MHGKHSGRDLQNGKVPCLLFRFYPSHPCWIQMIWSFTLIPTMPPFVSAYMLWESKIYKYRKRETLAELRIHGGDIGQVNLTCKQNHKYKQRRGTKSLELSLENHPKESCNEVFILPQISKLIFSVLFSGKNNMETDLSKSWNVKR